MHRSALTALRERLGVAAGPELASAVASAPRERVDALAEELVSADPASAVPVSPPRTETWPVVTVRASTFASGGVYRDAAGPAGLNLSQALSPRHAGSGRFSAGVLRALLYCHGLVIEDPIVMAADMYLGTSAEARPVARLALTAAVMSMSEIAELVDAGVVRTYADSAASAEPVRRLGTALGAELARSGSSFGTDDAWQAFEAGYVDGLSPALQQLWRRVRSGDRSPPLDLVEQGVAEGDVAIVETFVKVLADLRPQAVVDNAVDMVAAAVVAVERLGGFYDLLCPSPLFATLLFLGSPDPAHALRLHELGRAEVPNLDRLGVDDVVRIRQASDAFARWRADLTEALSCAHRLREDGSSAATIAETTADLMADARAAVHREARRTRLLNPANPVTFVAGALGGAVSGAAGGSVGVALGAAGGALAPLVQGLVNRRRVPVFERPIP